MAIPRAQLLAELFWIAVAGLVFYGIRSLPPADPGGLGPATFPKILAFGLLGLVGLSLLQSRKRAYGPAAESEAGGSALKALGLSGLAFASALLWESAGALPVLVVLSVVELRWIEGFAWPRVVAVGLSLSIGMWGVFTQLLGVSLPLGLLLWFY